MRACVCVCVCARARAQVCATRKDFCLRTLMGVFKDHILGF